MLHRCAWKYEADKVDNLAKPIRYYFRVQNVQTLKNGRSSSPAKHLRSSKLSTWNDIIFDDSSEQSRKKGQERRFVRIWGIFDQSQHWQKWPSSSWIVPETRFASRYRKENLSLAAYSMPCDLLAERVSSYRNTVSSVPTLCLYTNWVWKATLEHHPLYSKEAMSQAQ